MNKILEYLHFFSEWHVVFDVADVEYPFGKLPDKEGNVYESCHWFCKTINNKPIAEVDKILGEFDDEVSKLQVQVQSKKNKSGSSVSRAEIILALEKSKFLYRSIVPVETGNSNPISETVECNWRFKGDDIIYRTQVKFDDYERQVGKRWEQMLAFSEDFLTLYIFPFKVNLEKIIPLFKIILDSNTVTKKVTKKTLTTPNNFASPYFQSDVVNILYRGFVRRGYIIDTDIQRESFMKLFKTSKYQKKISPKVDWFSWQTNLRYFIHKLDEIFPMPALGNEQKWRIADDNFTAKGKTIDLSAGKANCHYGIPEAMLETDELMQKALLSYEASDSKKKVKKITSQ